MQNRFPEARLSDLDSVQCKPSSILPLMLTKLEQRPRQNLAGQCSFQAASLVLLPNTAEMSNGMKKLLICSNAAVLFSN